MWMAERTRSCQRGQGKNVCFRAAAPRAAVRCYDQAAWSFLLCATSINARGRREYVQPCIQNTQGRPTFPTLYLDSYSTPISINGTNTPSRQFASPYVGTAKQTPIHTTAKMHANTTMSRTMLS